MKYITPCTPCYHYLSIHWQALYQMFGVLSDVVFIRKSIHDLSQLHAHNVYMACNTMFVKACNIRYMFISSHDLSHISFIALQVTISQLFT